MGSEAQCGVGLIWPWYWWVGQGISLVPRGSRFGSWKGNPGHFGNELEAAFIPAFNLSDFRVIYSVTSPGCVPGLQVLA